MSHIELSQSKFVLFAKIQTILDLISQFLASFA